MKNLLHSKLWIKCMLAALIVCLPSMSFAYITRINVSNKGNDANNATDPGWGHTFKASADGKYVAFTTYASNIAPEDNNEVEDVFLRNTEMNTTTLISQSTEGGVGNSYSWVIDMTDNGRYVLFQSAASNLVEGDGNLSDDLFIRDTLNDTTTRVNVNNNGEEGNYSNLMGGIAMTPDARYILFYSSSSNLVANDNNERTDIFVRDRVKNITTRVNVSSGTVRENGAKGVGEDANGYSFSACGAGNLCPKSITPDGRYVIFASRASNLVSNDTNEVSDIFVRDLVNKSTTRVTLSSAATDGGGGSLSDAGAEKDGGDIISRDESTPSIGEQANSYFIYTKYAAISKDGRYVVFDSDATNLVSNDTNNTIDVFKRDTLKNITTRESVSSQGDQGISCNRCSQADSQLVDVSPDGRYILFKSMASNFVAGSDGVNRVRTDENGNRDGFVRDTVKRSTTIVTVDNNGNNGREYAIPSAMTSDGRFVLFYGIEDNILHNRSYKVDVFLRDLNQGKTTRVSDNDGNVANSSSNVPISISPEGTYSLFRSYASNLVADDNNKQGDIFLKLNKGTLSYTGVYNFEYPEGLKYKATTTAGSIAVTFTSSGSQYSYAAPLVVIAKATSQTTIDLLQSDAIVSFKGLLRKTFSASKEAKRTANGVDLTQLHFTGKIGGVAKKFIVSFIKVGRDIYVLTVSGLSKYSSDINTIADTITRTWGTNTTKTGDRKVLQQAQPQQAETDAAAF